MRINGFTQIKAFYSWTFENQDKRVKPQHVSLYLFLLNQNNRNNWIEWFKCPFDLAMTGSCISSKKTYYKCLNELDEWGLIQYKKGSNNWKAPLIKLEVLKDTSTVPQSEPLQEQLVEQVDEQLDEQLSTHKYKPTTNNNKTDNVEPQKETLYNIDKLIKFYLSDNKLCNAFISNKENKIKDKQHLGKRLQEFKVNLTEHGRHSETWKEFTTYFRNWNKLKKKTNNGSRPPKPVF